MLKLAMHTTDMHFRSRTEKEGTSQIFPWLPCPVDLRPNRGSNRPCTKVRFPPCLPPSPSLESHRSKQQYLDIVYDIYLYLQWLSVDFTLPVVWSVYPGRRVISMTESFGSFMSSEASPNNLYQEISMKEWNFYLDIVHMM